MPTQVLGVANCVHYLFSISFKVGTPTQSLHLDLMYCQNLFSMGQLIWSSMALKYSSPRT